MYPKAIKFGKEGLNLKEKDEDGEQKYLGRDEDNRSYSDIRELFERINAPLNLGSTGRVYFLHCGISSFLRHLEQLHHLLLHEQMPPNIQKQKH